MLSRVPLEAATPPRGGDLAACPRVHASVGRGSPIPCRAPWAVAPIKVSVGRVRVVRGCGKGKGGIERRCQWDWCMGHGTSVVAVRAHKKTLYQLHTVVAQGWVHTKTPCTALKSVDTPRAK